MSARRENLVNQGENIKLKLFTFIVLLFLILPVFIIIPISFSSSQFLTFPPPGFSLQWYERFFTDSEWMAALSQSFKTGALSTLASLVLGIMAAEGLAKCEFRGKNILQELFMLPMIVPTIITAIALYRFESGLSISGTTLGLVTAHTLLALPFVISTVLSRLVSLDPNLEQAAMSLGANRLRAFIVVTMPIIRPALVSAALFAFATSFDELVVTLFIAGVSSRTLPLQIWNDIRSQLDPTVTAIASILIVTVAIIMFASNFGTLFEKKRKTGETGVNGK